MTTLGSSSTTCEPIAPPAVAPTAGADLWQPPAFSRELVRKYDRPAPRYTSYPTAPFFEEEFDAAAYRRLLVASAASAAPLSLYVHIPFCRKRCFFCGCNVTISRSPERGLAYLADLERELDTVASLAAAGERRLVQVHWGGGTPSFLPADGLRRLGHRIRERFSMGSETEFGVEVDPRHCSEEQLDALAEVGVNRLSLGVQDVESRVQEAVNRVQPLELTHEVIAGARRRGIESVNVDLIYGLPHQTAASFARTLERVLELRPDRLAVFNFAYLPAMFPHQRVIDGTALPSPEEKLTILENVVEGLTGAGYVFIGMDHFARPEDPLAQALRQRTLTRNFQGYSTWGGSDLIGLGASAIGQLADGYAQNLRDEVDYRAAVAASGLATTRGLRLSPEDILRREVIVRLMCDFRLDKAAIGERFGISFDEHFAPEQERLAPLAADGLVELTADSLEITALGRLMVRNVAMVFDQYLDRGGVRFSRTV